MMISLFCLICVACAVPQLTAQRLSEQDRVDLWLSEGNTWPPKWQEETEGMQKLMAHREHEVMTQIKGGDERWENWLQLTQSRLVPRFTERGFDIIPTPPVVHQKLRDAVMAGVEDWDNLRTEGKIDVIFHPSGMEPKFVHLGGLSKEVIDDLRPYHEEWGGMELIPTSAYGVRLYQNGSSLVMHHDKVRTHVISSIVHIAHEYDDEDETWPIQIEDHDGNLHSVNLEPGQMLFYESAKMLHGRMKTFKGKYYGSIFLHYQPKDDSIWSWEVNDIINKVPPHWREGIDPEEGKGSRWCGAAVSIDSRVAEGAPPRIEGGRLIKETTPHPYDYFHPAPEEYPQDFSNDYSPHAYSLQDEL